MGWTIQHKIPEHEALDFIRSKTKTPVAIILVGGNDENIEKVAKAVGMSLCTSLYNFYEVIEPASLIMLPQNIFCIDHFAIVEILRGYSSARKFRHEVVQALRDRGAKTIVMLHIEGDPEHDNANACAVNEELHRQPPTVDGIDYLFTLEP